MGEFDRAIVRNAARGDVNVLHLDARRLRRGDYADEVWDSL